MTDEADDRSQRWAWPTSVAAHALVAALLIFGLPLSLPQPQEEQVVSVTIEPPEETEAAAQPPEQAKAEPAPVAEPVTEQAPPPPAAAQQAPTPPAPVLQPVVRYGETDAGPRESLEGSSAEDDPAATEQALRPEAAETTEEAVREDAADDPVPDDSADDPEAPETAAPEEPESVADDAESGPQLIIAGEDGSWPVSPPVPTPRPEPPAPRTVEAAADVELRPVSTLFSRSSTGGPTATTAMAGLPRGVRAGRLCASELRLQLQYGPQPRLPDLLPSYQLASGTVLTVRRGAFRAGGTWYNLSFECQVDPDATSVVSFAFDVGAPLTREEQQQRGLPSR